MQAAEPANMASGHSSYDIGVHTSGPSTGLSTYGPGAPGQRSSNVGVAPGGILSSTGRPEGVLMGGDQRLHNSGYGWTTSIPVSTDVARGDIDVKRLVIHQVFWPINYTAPTLPVMVRSLRTQKIGDEGIIIKKTRMVDGMVHFNVDIRQVLTGGVFHQEYRVVPFETFGRDIYNAWTTHLYSTELEITDPQIVEDNIKKWASAHSGVLTATEAYVRRAMVDGLPSIYNLTAEIGRQSKYVDQTYMVCNRNPTSFVAAIVGIVNEAIIGARFQPGNGVIGDTLLVPRVCFVRYFGNAQKQAMTLYEHRGSDKYTMLTTYEIAPGTIVSTATSSEGGFKVGNINVVPYDPIPPGIIDGIGDEFFQRRIMQASIVMTADVKSALVRTPNGSRTLTPVDAAISASVYFEDAHLTDRGKVDNNKTELSDSITSQFSATVGGTWAMQTPAAARALVGWLARIVSELGDDEVANKVLMHTGAALPTLEQANDMDHLELIKNLTKGAGNSLVLQLAALPGNRTVISYLHSVVPFVFCNWTIYIAGFATFGDLYLIHPQCMTLVSADNLLVKQYDPTTVRPPWIKINSRIAAAYTGTLPDVRIPSGYAEDISFSLRKLGTAATMIRDDHAESNASMGENQRPDAFAVFSGVMEQSADWCFQGPDSITHMPTQSQIFRLFEDSSTASNVMVDILKTGHWLRTDDNSDTAVDMTRECDTRCWVPYPATMTIASSNTTVHQKGYEQLEFPPG